MQISSIYLRLTIFVVTLYYMKGFKNIFGNGYNNAKIHNPTLLKFITKDTQLYLNKWNDIDDDNNNIQVNIPRKKSQISIHLEDIDIFENNANGKLTIHILVSVKIFPF